MIRIIHRAVFRRCPARVKKSIESSVCSFDFSTQACNFTRYQSIVQPTQFFHRFGSHTLRRSLSVFHSAARVDFLLYCSTLLPNAEPSSEKAEGFCISLASSKRNSQEDGMSTLHSRSNVASPLSSMSLPLGFELKRETILIAALVAILVLATWPTSAAAVLIIGITILCSQDDFAVAAGKVTMRIGLRLWSAGALRVTKWILLTLAATSALLGHGIWSALIALAPAMVLWLIELYPTLASELLSAFLTLGWVQSIRARVESLPFYPAAQAKLAAVRLFHSQIIIAIEESWRLACEDSRDPKLNLQRRQDSFGSLGFTAILSFAYHIGWIFTGLMLYSFVSERLEHFGAGYGKHLTKHENVLVNFVGELSMLFFALAFAFYFFRTIATTCQRRYLQRVQDHVRSELVHFTIEVEKEHGAKVFDEDSSGGWMRWAANQAEFDAPPFLRELAYAAGNQLSIVAVLLFLAVFNKASALILFFNVALGLAYSLSFLIAKRAEQRKLAARQSGIRRRRIDLLDRRKRRVIAATGGAECYRTALSGDAASLEADRRVSNDEEYRHESPSWMWFFIFVTTALVAPIAALKLGHMSMRVFMMFLFSSISLSQRTQQLKANLANIVTKLPDMLSFFIVRDEMRVLKEERAGMRPSHPAYPKPNSSEVILRSVTVIPSEQSPIFHNLSLELPDSDILLVGPAGSGKSTLLDIVCGERRVDSGQVFIGGHAVGNSLSSDIDPRWWVQIVTDECYPWNDTLRRIASIHTRVEPADQSYMENKLVAWLQKAGLWSTLCRKASPYTFSEPVVDLNTVDTVDMLELRMDKIAATLSDGELHGLHLALRSFGIFYQVQTKTIPRPRIIAIDGYHRIPPEFREWFSRLARHYGARLWITAPDDSFARPGMTVVRFWPPYLEEESLNLYPCRVDTAEFASA